MQISKWMSALCLSGAMLTGSAWAADTATAQPKLESISGNSAAAKDAQDDCPTHPHKDKCAHKAGEPCPYHGKGHHEHEHDHCEYDKAGSKQ